MFFLTLIIPLLLLIKACMLHLTNEHFSFSDLLHSIMAFKSPKYLVNYSRKERNIVRINNYINLLLILAILGLFIYAVNLLLTQ